MKRLVLLCLVMATSYASEAQKQPILPVVTPNELYQQLLSYKPNTTGAYFGTFSTVTATGAAATPIGRQLDTSCSGCRQSPLKLGTVKILKKTSYTGDTAVPSPLYGAGSYTLRLTAWKATTTTTTTPVCTATPYQSDDFYSWVPASGLSASVLSPTAAYVSSVTAAPTTCEWPLSTKGNFYYMISIACITDTAVYQSSIHYIKTQSVNSR